MLVTFEVERVGEGPHHTSETEETEVGTSVPEDGQNIHLKTKTIQISILCQHKTPTSHNDTHRNIQTIIQRNRPQPHTTPHQPLDAIVQPHRNPI